MKLTKKNILAVGAAVMMTASLATFASASTSAFTGTPLDADPASYEIVDIDVSALDLTKMLEGTPIVDDTIAEAGVASVVAVEGVDLSDLDLTNLEVGEPIALGPVDVDTVDGKVTCGVTAASLEAANVDLTNLDNVKVWEGELEAIGTIDPATIPGGFTTAAASK